jgi:hypothetical protein
MSDEWHDVMLSHPLQCTQHDLMEMYLLLACSNGKAVANGKMCRSYLELKECVK